MCFGVIRLFNREFKVRIDDKDVNLRDRHLHLESRNRLGLVPCLNLLHLWDIRDSDFLLMSRGYFIELYFGRSCLAFGEIVDVFREYLNEGVVVHISFARGYRFWETFISFSVEKYSTADQVIAGIIGRYNEEMSRIDYRSRDHRFRYFHYTDGSALLTRGMVFHGHAAECMSKILAFLGCRGYVIQGGVVPALSGSASRNRVTLDRRQLMHDPSFTNHDLMILKTAPMDIQVGSWLTVNYGHELRSGMLVESSFDIDNREGNWSTELLVELGYENDRRNVSGTSPGPEQEATA